MNEIATEYCYNGGCTKSLYRGKHCFRCWAGVKWTSVRQRVENKNGNNPSYEGIPLTFTKETLIKWVSDNPPPRELDIPSIDRVIPHLGYIPGNIRWLERNKNSSGTQRDIEEGKWKCFRCKRILPLTIEYFNKNVSTPKGFQTYCNDCRRVQRIERKLLCQKK